MLYTETDICTMWHEDNKVHGMLGTHSFTAEIDMKTAQWKVQLMPAGRGVLTRSGDGLASTLLGLAADELVEETTTLSEEFIESSPTELELDMWNEMGYHLKFCPPTADWSLLREEVHSGMVEHIGDIPFTGFDRDEIKQACLAALPKLRTHFVKNECYARKFPLRVEFDVYHHRSEMEYLKESRKKAKKR